jgi:mannan endo-1,6-alpha-mannosidase
MLTTQVQDIKGRPSEFVPANCNQGSIKSAAKTVAKGLLASYNGNKAGEVPGIFDVPYFWWSGGAVWDAMVDYWYLTGDDSYNDIVKQALSWQRGPNNDYMPPNQTKSEVGTACSPNSISG